MANSSFLRNNKNQHKVKNISSKKMDRGISLTVDKVVVRLTNEFPDFIFGVDKSLKLSNIIEKIIKNYPKYSEFLTKTGDTSFIKPDGGFIYAKRNNSKKIICVAEIKKQGTNDERAKEGKKIQSKGNAIERLGKNLIGIRAIFKSEEYIPFVCFGSGVDFEEGSTILDRVRTMNDFFPLNQTNVEKKYIPFEPVSMYFRLNPWTEQEMEEIIYSICKKSLRFFK